MVVVVETAAGGKPDQDVSAAWNVKMKERNSTSGMQKDSGAAEGAS